MAAKRWFTVSLVAVSLLVFVGCSFEKSDSRDVVPHDAESGGQTLDEMNASLVEAFPGVHVSRLSSSDGPNLKGNTGYSLTFDVDPDRTIVDGAAFVDFVVESVWSVRDGYMPNSQISISVSTSSPEGYDVVAAAAEAGWVASREPNPQDFSDVAIVLTADKEWGAHNRDRLGPWPGDAPEIPTGVTASK
ncbi:hypothetical protein AB0O87_13005 [Microbacterium sp. NPDC076768]|uniref:hypothetical protein n=1 Tax=Microbacterium sp. NPDC076768 TaxID=3154858 RepID=UPI00341A043D